jgi:hypothetical protein
VTKREELQVEVSIQSTSQVCGGNTSGVWVTAAWAHFFGESERRQGGYLAPHVSFRHHTTTVADSSWSCSGLASGSETQLTVGADIGYRWRFGPMFLEPTFGFGVGVCQNCVASTGLFSSTRRPIGLAGSLNIQLLRLGFSL